MEDLYTTDNNSDTATDKGHKYKHTIKDSVFTNLFNDPKYLIELYRSLHPEDTESDESDLSIVTIANVLTDGQYNDLGFKVGTGC